MVLMTARYKNFILWYHHLRAEGVRMYGADQRCLPLHARYNKWNCFRWAVSNSGTHNIDGSYLE